VAAAACTAVAAVVKADRHGDVMLEVVQLVADLVKKRDCRCDPEACALQPHKSKSISRVPIPIQFINHVLRDAFKGPFVSCSVSILAPSTQIPGARHIEACYGTGGEFRADTKASHHFAGPSAHVITCSSHAVQVLTCLYGMDIRDAEMPTFDKKQGGKAKKRKRNQKKTGVLADVQTAFKEADAGEALAHGIPSTSLRYADCGGMDPRRLQMQRQHGSHLMRSRACVSAAWCFSLRWTLSEEIANHATHAMGIKRLVGFQNHKGNEEGGHASLHPGHHRFQPRSGGLPSVKGAQVAGAGGAVRDPVSGAQARGRRPAAAAGAAADRGRIGER